MNATQMAPDQVLTNLTANPSFGRDSTLRILVLGSRIDPAGSPDLAQQPVIAGFHFAAIADLGPGLLAAVQPDLILSPLMAGPHDVIDVARRLTELGFVGRYRALAAALPQPEIILAEVRAIAPALDFDLFIVTADPSAPTN